MFICCELVRFVKMNRKRRIFKNDIFEQPIDWERVLVCVCDVCKKHKKNVRLDLYYRVIKNNKGNFTYSCPVCTPKDTPRTRFWPPPDPPIFMAPCCKAPPGRVFLLFQLFNIKTQKNTKNARILPYLCVYKFFHEQKKHAFLQKNIGQNRNSYILKQKCLERFSSLKKLEKTCKKHVF